MGNLASPCIGDDLVEGSLQLRLKFRNDFPLGPLEALEVLHPFKVGNGNASRVA